MLTSACLFALAGCATGDVSPEFYPIAAWYDVSAAGGFASDNAPTPWETDFESLRRLGFNAVFLHRSSGTDVDRVTDIAERHGLHVALPDADADYYVRTGQVPPGHLTLESVAAQCRRRRAAIVRLGLVTDDASADRLRRLAERHHALSDVPLTYAAIAPSADVDPATFGVTLCSAMPMVTFDPSEMAFSDPIGNMVTIRATRKEGQAFPDVSQLLLAYHRALANGQVAGVIVDQFAGSVAGWRGLVAAHGQMSAAESAAIKRITGRAGRWGPRLRRTSPGIISYQGEADDALQVVAFVGEKRRYIMLLNRSLDRFVQSTIEVTETLDDPPVSRLVGVPAGSATVVGEVLPVRQGRATLNPHLAPGDALLYEVF